MTNLTKAYLDLFIAVSLLVTFGQDIYRLSSSSTQTEPSTGIKENGVSNATNSETESLPQLEGVVIHVSDGLRKPLLQLLKTQKYNVKVQSYKFQGSDWWFQTVINYGHIILVYMLMSKYKTETNEQTKKKIMWGGALAVLGWFFIMPMFKQNKISIQVKGVKVYDKAGFVPNEIISSFADQLDIAELEQQPIVDDQF